MDTAEPRVARRGSSAVALTPRVAAYRPLASAGKFLKTVATLQMWRDFPSGRLQGLPRSLLQRSPWQAAKAHRALDRFAGVVMMLTRAGKQPFAADVRI